MKRLWKIVSFLMTVGSFCAVMLMSVGNMQVYADAGVAQITKNGASTPYATLEAAIAAAEEGDTIKVLENITLTKGIEISNGKKIILDLNGKEITNSTTETYTDAHTNADRGDYLLAVCYGGELTVLDSSDGGSGQIWTETEKVYCGIKMTVPDDAGNGIAKLTVQSGKIQGYYYGISGNGNRNQGTEITITGGRIVGYDSADSTGIYQPQIGTLNIQNGEIIGATGIEIRSGTLNVTGGTIRGLSSAYGWEANGNGTTTVGAGIAIAQHTTKNSINVSLTGGTVSGRKDVSIANPQNNEMDNVNVSMSKTFAENLTDELPEDYIWMESGNDYILHKHSYGDAAWRWLLVNKKWTATSVYSCGDQRCGSKKYLSATITDSTSEGTTTYTATDSEGKSDTRSENESYTVTFNGKSKSVKWGEIVTLTASGVATWKINGRPVAGGIQTYSFAVTENSEVTTDPSTASGQSAEISTLLTSKGNRKADFNAKWSLPVGSKVKSVIIYRGKTNTNEVLSTETLLKGTQYDTGLRVLTGDFTLHLKNLTAGTYQHVMIQIHYTKDGIEQEPLTSDIKKEKVF